MIHAYIHASLMSVTFLCCLTNSNAQIVMNREEAITKGVLCCDDIESEILRCRNKQLAYDNIKKSYLPAISLTMSPLSFNHSMRLLQSPVDGDYYNVNDYTNTSASGVTLTQKVRSTGGKLSLSSFVSLLRNFSGKNTSVSASPVYFGYSQPLFGGGKSVKLECEIQVVKTSLATKRLYALLAEKQQEISSLYLLAYTQYANIVISEKSVAISDSLQSFANIRRSQGRITAAEFDMVRCQYIDDRMELAKAQHDLAETRRKLELMLKCDSVAIEEPQYSFLPLNLSETEYMERVKQNNPYVLSHKLEERMAAKDVHDVRSETRFNADVSLSYGLNQYASNFQKAYSHPSQSQSVNVTLRIPVFQWGINKNRRVMAKNEYEAVRKEQMQKSIELQETTRRLVVCKV